jgi:AcrR family transcriptional regulator
MTSRVPSGKTPASKRDQLIATALELFSAHGFHATGIDRIAAVAKVTKKTMYTHFRSKEELILAALRHQDGTFRHEFMQRVAGQGSTPYDRLLGVFDAAHTWFQDKKFHGCLFINVIGEYSSTNTEIRALCKEYKALIRGHIEDLAREVKVADPKQLAASLALLLEGSIVTAQVSGSAESAGTARQAAQVLIDNALKKARARAR